jgi:hypothetical protein
MTGKEFELIKAPDGGIVGVRSSSEDVPLKIAGFNARDPGFQSAQKYADWRFIHTAPQPAAGAKPAAKPAAATPAPGPTGLEGTNH